MKANSFVLRRNQAVMLILCGAAASASAQTTVVPNANATVAGGASPFDTVTREFPRSYQQVFAASELNIPNGATITGFSLRSSNFAGANPTGTWPAQARTWADYDIFLGKAANPPGSMSLTFAANVVPGSEMQVHDGTLTIPVNSFSNTVIAPAANPWSTFIFPMTPFTYTGGDLVLTIRHSGHATAAFLRHFPDVIVNPLAPPAPTQVVAFSDNTSPTGTLTQSAPCVVQFQFTGGGGTTCYANCDNSTVAPCLNVNDFICFGNQFAAGVSYANCDASTIPPVLNVNDFICFGNMFAAGCGANNCMPHP